MEYGKTLLNQNIVNFHTNFELEKNTVTTPVKH